MELKVPSDIEVLMEKRLSSGRYASAEDVLRRALEAQDEAETSSDEQRLLFRRQIEEGFAQAEDGQLTPSDQARIEISEMKTAWRNSPRR